MQSVYHSELPDEVSIACSLEGFQRHVAALHAPLVVLLVRDTKMPTTLVRRLSRR
jgi:hypothetical protein